MEVIRNGFRYKAVSENKGYFQEIQFVEREKQFDNSLAIKQDGYTECEILNILIDRVNFVAENFNDINYASAISDLKKAANKIKLSSINDFVIE